MLRELAEDVFAQGPYAGGICLPCIGNTVLRRLYEERLLPEPCAVCGGQRAGLSVQQIVRAVRGEIRDWFEPHVDLYPGYDGLSLAAVVGRVIGCEHAPFCETVAGQLHEPGAGEDALFHPEQRYQQRRLPFESEQHEDDYLLGEWEAVVHALRHEQRFYNDRAERFFASLFDEALQAKVRTVLPSWHKPAAILELGTGVRMFRARCCDDDAKLARVLAQPERELGAAPRARANSNRMNPAGVPLFYGAGAVHTSVAEVRPSIGDRVAVGTFQPERALKLFDFRGLDQRIDPQAFEFFRGRADERLRRRHLLKHLHRLISLPARPGGEGYLVTQVMIEYLRYRHEERFDGVAFRSVQDGAGVNYVIFSEDEPDSPSASSEREPRFPLRLVGAPAVHEVQALAYRLDPPLPRSDSEPD
ncbi:RES family NAD+ phosphorylase [Lysobacter firmicutimachus]|uniref:RES family NAD+ phosphorylase n=1 Tax=Lysobacter firmicutimachus TaxID=1792846 RepID=A0AAU8MQA9_9GAMM